MVESDTILCGQRFQPIQRLFVFVGYVKKIVNDFINYVSINLQNIQGCPEHYMADSAQEKPTKVTEDAPPLDFDPEDPVPLVFISQYLTS